MYVSMLFAQFKDADSLGQIFGETRTASLPLLFRLSAPEIGPSTIMQAKAEPSAFVLVAIGEKIKLGGAKWPSQGCALLHCPSFSSQVMAAATLCKRWRKTPFCKSFFLKWFCNISSPWASSNVSSQCASSNKWAICFFVKNLSRKRCQCLIKWYNDHPTGAQI